MRGEIEVSPPPERVSSRKVKVTDLDYMEFSDVVDFQMVDPIITEYVKEQGYQAAETLDVVMREVLNSGTSVFYAGGKASRATLAAGDKFSIKDLRAIVRNFKKNNVRPAMNGHYVAMITPDTEFDLYDDAEFRAMMEIGNNNKPLIDGEIIRMYNTVFMTIDLIAPLPEIFVTP